MVIKLEWLEIMDIFVVQLITFASEFLVLVHGELTLGFPLMSCTHLIRVRLRAFGVFGIRILQLVLLT